MNQSLHRHLAHPPPIQRHNQPTVLHVTICVTGRQKILATPEVQAAFVDAWRNATHWLAGHYVIMPDHVHKGELRAKQPGARGTCQRQRGLAVSRESA